MRRTILMIAIAILLADAVHGAIVIRRSEVKSAFGAMAPPSSINDGSRIVSIIPGGDKHHRKRDNVVEPEPPAVPEEVPTANKPRTFTKNQLRPCTFCKFFTTIAPTAKPPAPPDSASNIARKPLSPL
ncbi:uncharacterized protein LOC128276612 [Anopheles cruzii]|uniref:uncharacterized protein LOC128276612 n=1 Tax=Anopheles cruzii TaxID=68878 RepID=UPI0022EC5D95|nr:uncharacterized protein LOC128276612 [Anopheles cruzii]